MDSMILWFLGGVAVAMGAISFGVIFIQIVGGKALKGSVTAVETDVETVKDRAVKKAA